MVAFGIGLFVYVPWAVLGLGGVINSKAGASGRAPCKCAHVQRVGQFRFLY